MNPYRPQPFQVRPTRTTQPYRNDGRRQPGLVLDNMRAGRPIYGQNPMDLARQFQGMAPPKEGSLGWYLLRRSGFYS